MEFRDNLLQNEVHHLGDNFKLLSTELLLIQDFIKEEYGSKFLAFCNARREQQRPSFSKSSMIAKSSLSSPRKSKPIPKKFYSQAAVVEECEEMMFGVDEEPCIIPIPDSQDGSESDFSEQEFDPMEVVEFDMEEGKFEIESKYDPNSAVEKIFVDSRGNEHEANKKGRRKSIIHRYFEKVQAEDGKLKDKCQTCGNFVSSQAQRLKKHLLKCRGKDSKVMQILDKLQIQKYTTSSRDNKSGRKSDVVRLAFQPAKDISGYNKMKCMNCGELVSNQPSRMRNHLHRCTGDGNFENKFDLKPRNEQGTPHTLENQTDDISSNCNSDNNSRERSQTSAPSRPSSSSGPQCSSQSRQSPVLVKEDAHNLSTQIKLSPESQNVVTAGHLYTNSNNSHEWAPADQMSSFASTPLSYLIPPPGSSYQH